MNFASPPLRTVRVQRYVTPLREGGSLPAVVEADDQGFAAGRVTVEVTNWNRLPAILVAAGVVKPELAPTVARGMQALAAQTPDTSVLSLTLVMENGRMSFGPFPLGPAPRMLPPTG